MNSLCSILHSKIFIAAVKDDGQAGLTNESYTALTAIAGETVKNLMYRGSFAMIASRGKTTFLQVSAYESIRFHKP